MAHAVTKIELAAAVGATLIAFSRVSAIAASPVFEGDRPPWQLDIGQESQGEASGLEANLYSFGYNPHPRSLAVPGGSFLALAQDLFVARTGRPATDAEENWTPSKVQLVRVPKAASSEASVVARQLGGCEPKGPCCKFPGDPRGSCPARGLMCPQDYEACFREMGDTPRFRNVASKMLAGFDAYDEEASVCVDEDESIHCDADMEDVIAGACNLNFITICEAWGSSLLLLFETIPWLGPTEDFFPDDQSTDGAESEVQGGARKVRVEGELSRHNSGKRHEEGIRHITPELMQLARDKNAADEQLYDFVTAKFCTHLRAAALLDSPIVQEELLGTARLGHRCNDPAWASQVLERYARVTPSQCRLYEPLTRPQGLAV